MSKANDRDHVCGCEGVGCAGKQQELSPDLERLRAHVAPYAFAVSVAMAGLAQAVEAALNARDAAVLDEMRAVAIEIFDQADLAMDNDRGTIQ